MSNDFDEDETNQKFMLERITEFQKQSTEEDESQNIFQKQEYEILVNRILQILTTTIKHTELIFCIPQMMKNLTLMLKYLTKEQFSILQNIEKSVPHNQNIAINSSDINCKLSEVFFILTKSDLMGKIPDYIENISENGKYLLENLKQLKNLANWRMKIIAPMDIAKEQMLQQTWKKNKKLEEKTNSLRCACELEQEKIHSTACKKSKIINNLKEQIEKIKKENRDYLNQQINDSEINMMNICKNRYKQQVLLEEEVKLAKQNYETLLEKNLTEEKGLKDKAFKLKTHYKTWLTKYDTDVGEHTEKLAQLNEQLMREQEVLNKLKEYFNAQEIEYNDLMLEKKMKEKRVQEEKLLLFMMERAATIIQRAWRKVLAKRKKKSKKGKGKGKKKK